jgi:hypothetical protein
MHSAQDWCLQCGAGAPDSLAAGTPGWRSTTAILSAVAILVLAAAAATYAALNRSHKTARPATVTVARTPPPAAAATTPAAGTPTTTPPTAASKLGTPTTVKPLPAGTVKPPKIPLAAVTPTPIPATKVSTSPTSRAGVPSTTTPASALPESSTTVREPRTQAITLDTNAASTYNPYNFPASNFGDPSLAIDGETSTAWTAVLDPEVAPKMAEGLALDLNSAQKLSALVLITSTPGMTVQVYATNAPTLPTSITDPTWVQLSPTKVAAGRQTRIKLIDKTKAFRWVLLWISRAPEASVGTPQAPGHVSVNEVELFPTAKS